MPGALDALVADARGRLDGRHPAFAAWSRTGQAGAVDPADALDVFAAEAALAAAARLAVEARTGPRAATFPHLYGPLYAWFEPAEPPALGDDPIPALARVFELAVPAAVRRRFGHVSTSAPIVRSMLDAVGFAGGATLHARLIDPACGAGAFMLEAARRVLEAARDEGLGPAGSIDAVRRAVHGIDLSPPGVLLAEAGLALQLAPLLAELPPGERVEPLRLEVADALAGTPGGGFDVVVANPPYAKLPSRLLTPEQRERFARTTHGHPNLYALFLQVGVELLRDGGRLAFIVPTSFVSGRYFRNLRSFLRDELSLERFDVFEERTGVFEGVLQEVAIVVASRSRAQAPQIELHAHVAGGPSRVVRLPARSVLLGPELDGAFLLEPDPLPRRLLERMLRRGRPLAELGYAVSTGTIVWNRVRELIRDDADGGALPLVWGSGIRPFRFGGPGTRGGSTHVALAPRSAGVVSRGEAVLVKRMTSKEEPRRLVACRLPDGLAGGYFAENHVNLVRRAGPTPVELDAVLGLLGSTLFDTVFRALNGNTQVSATELELLPVATGPELAGIAAAARALTAAGGGEAAALDELVADLYGLDGEERAALADRRGGA